jgi:lipopolysaccharide transport system ATP-binding protein
MPEPVISVDRIGKQYRVGAQRVRHDTLRDQIADAVTTRLKRRAERFDERTFWALRNVSLQVEQGDVLGLIGRNGAGKSTLLKILSRVTEPTEGRAQLRGRVGSLLEVGTGFHPELTGRENIYLYGAILGMRRREIARKFDEIVAFAETDRYLDTPVKRYSTGMYLRLAFAVAAHLEPEILLVDEVLAVGDAAFQRKCLGKMSEVGDEGRTVVFVSHNMAALSSLCSSAVLLERGAVSTIGPTNEVIDTYLASVESDGGLPLSERLDRLDGSRIRFTRVSFANANGNRVEFLRTGEPAQIRLDYKSPTGESFRNVIIRVTIESMWGQVLYVLDSNDAHANIERASPAGRFVCKIPKLALRAGTYPLTLWVSVGGAVLDEVQEAGRLRVEDGDWYGTGKLPRQGILMTDCEWSIESAGEPPMSVEGVEAS